MHTQLLRFSFGLWFVVSALTFARSAAGQPSASALQSGENFIETQVYSQEADHQLLVLYDGLRVADVSDGMDKVGLTNTGLVDPEVRPLWRDTEKYSHRFIGIAVTARYVPTNKPHAAAMETQAFDEWVGRWYGQLSPEPFVPLLREGSALVIEDAPRADVGSIGSNNILSWRARGCVGVVTSGSARDIDEIIAQRVPLYYARPGRGIRPGRNEIESVNRPVVIGGVTVMPGDVIVADGDGVIVVPRDQAEDVARYARGVLDGDKAGRRRLYERLNIPLDDSVK